MAQWDQMHALIPRLPPELLADLYPVSFPMDVRHYLAHWIEEQPWETFDVDTMEQDAQAHLLRDKIVVLLHDQAQQHQNILERMRLQSFSKNMSVVQPMVLVKVVRDTLRKERQLISTVGPIASSYQPIHAQHGTQAQAAATHIPNKAPTWLKTQDMDNLVLKVLEVRNYRQTMHQMREELTWERQDLDPAHSPCGELDQQQQAEKQKRIQHLEIKYQECGKKRVLLLHETIGILQECQKCLLQRIKDWRWEQHQATIGQPFDDNLVPLQTWCEQLLGVNVQLRQEVILMGQDHGSPEPFAEMQDQLGLLFKTLIQSCMVVDKQPPQVIKTQSKFSTTVRYLLGEKVANLRPIQLKANVITEAQARNLGQPGGIVNEAVGDLINSTALLEHNPSSRSMTATFRNMSIKKIKRADRKGSESVTEEKFAILFTADIALTGCDTAYSVQAISLPVVIIVHGSQDNNAMATIIWDCAFSEPNRIPFIVPDQVPWSEMRLTLSRKFMTEVQTRRPLDDSNLHFLAQKMFNRPDSMDDFSNMRVSWCQFNKEVLPGRPFTFWQWFDGVMDLSKAYLEKYWSDGLIFGFIGKQHLHVILQNKPNGTFLLRFSDSEIGGITIAYIATTENGGRKIQNIQPFTKRDLGFRSLADRIRDLNFITHVYPDLPKNEGFGRYYSDVMAPLPPTTEGYLPTIMTTTVVHSVEHPSPMTLGSDDMQIPAFTPATQFPTIHQFPSAPVPTGQMFSPDQFDPSLSAMTTSDQEPQIMEILQGSIYDFNGSI